MLSLTFTNFQNKSTRWPDRDLYDRRELVLISLLSSASARINKKWKFLEAALRSWKELLFWKVTRSLPDLGKCIFWWLISAVVVVKIDFFFSVFSLLLQDPDRDWSGHSPDGPGRAGLSEQRRVTCLIKLEHDGIFSSQKETGVIFVCCTFTPLFHSTIKKKSFWSKITNVFISVYSEYSDFCLLPFLQHIHSIFSAHIFCSCKQTSWFHQLCFFFCLSVEFSSRGNVSGNLSGAQLYLSASCCGPECVVFSEYTGAVERYSYYSLTWFFSTFRHMSEIDCFDLPDVSYNRSSFSF